MFAGSRWISLATLIGLLALPLTQVQGQDEASRVRILLVLDTDDRQGPAWGLDGDNMKAVLEATMKKLGLENRYTLEMFTGAQAEPNNVLDYYRQLDTNPSETLLFYFSGHGGYHGKKGHYIALVRGKLYRNDLIAAMKRKNPRLVVLMTDCCANVEPLTGALVAEPPRHKILKSDDPAGPAGPPAKIQEPPAHVVQGQAPAKVEFRPPVRIDPNLFLRSGPKAKIEEPPHVVRISDTPGQPPDPKAKVEEPNIKVRQRPPVILRAAGKDIPLEEVIRKVHGEPLRHLLFLHKGIADINGCEKGELSNGTVFWGGSLFTIAFLQLQMDAVAAFDKNGDGFIEWNEFFPIWRDTCESAGRRITRGQLRQVPAIFQLQVEPAK